MLVINLSTTSATYAQVDTVTGQVIFQPGDFYPLATQPVRVMIEVTGRTKTKIATTDQSYGVGDLFWSRVAELYGSQTVFPFAFAFPARASPVDPSVVDMRSWTEQMMTVRSDHVLPPTFHEGNAAFVACVEYQVRATVWTQQSQFGPARILCEQSVPQSVKSALLPAEREEGDKKGARSLWHWHRHRPRPSVPSVHFQLQLTVPVRIHVGEEIPCVLSIIPLPECASVPETLGFILRGFSVSVKGKTKVWAATSIQGDQTKSQFNIILDNSTDKLNVLLRQESGYTKAILSPAVQNGAPTFKTYNIKRMYVLRVTAHVICAGIGNTISGETDLVVLPGTSDDASRPQGNVDVHDASDLPSYIQATSDIIQAAFSIAG
ncbi:hypothetical protein BDW62DRAFT_220574 [Aspergillus aurantiobrunneus]